MSFTKNPLPSEEPSPTLAVLIPHELTGGVHLLEVNSEVIRKQHLIGIGTAREISPADTPLHEKNSVWRKKYKINSGVIDREPAELV